MEKVEAAKKNLVLATWCGMGQHRTHKRPYGRLYVS
jgi:hypothetical protein